MARRQGAAGHRGTEATLTVAIHDLAQGEAVLKAAAAAGIKVRLATAPGAAGYAGVAYLHALEAQLSAPLLVDCGRDAGLVMAALRTGSRQVLFTGESETATKLADIARQQGARVLRRMPGPVRRPAASEDPVAHLADHLGTRVRSR